MSAPPTAWFRRVDAVLDAALDLEPGEQTAFVEQACGDDEALRAEVLALLRVHHDSGGFLDVAAARIAALVAGARHAAGGAAAFGTDEGPRRIGPYRVLRELGRGGMGVVYLAERDDGQYRHRVAIKVLRDGLHGDELRRRFLAERQILASLSHPNIAALLDGGVADGELPYLVVEYVDGEPITTYCDRRHMGVEARLRLFQDVCAAVQHAHQNLVLHRDLKPGNVLVTSDGVVKLLDFGIAKLLDPSASEIDQALTRTGLRLMTPAYASPEQVRGDPLSTASDVYALGLLLYELLAGVPAQRITADTPQAVLEAVCRRDPGRPSARVAGADRLARRLRGDLDAIVSMALRKEADRRYGSAALLAADVGRHLEGRPVLAHRGSRWYRLEKFLGRHRAAVAVAAASAVLLIGGAIVSLRLAAEAATERDRAALARDRASAALAQTSRALRESEAVTTFLVSLFEASDASEGRQDSLTATDLLRRGVARVDRLSTEPLAQARMLEALGRVYESVEDLPRAEALLRRAMTLRRAHLGPDNVQTASLEARLADVLLQRGQSTAADSLARDALRTRRRALGDAHPDVAASLRQVGKLALMLQDERTGEVYQREAVAVDRRAGPSADSALARDLTELGMTLGRHGDADGAERALREAREAARRSSPDQFPLYLGITAWLAQSLDERMATRAEGEALLRDALAETRVRYGDGHAETGGVMASLGAMLVRHGRGADGERLIREALAIHRRTLGPSSTATASDMLGLAEALTRDGYSAEAERLDRDVVAIYATTFGTSHAAYGAVLAYLADVIALRGALDSAEALYGRALAIRGATPTSQRPSVALSRAGLAAVLTRQGRFAEADTLFRQALDVMVPITTERNMNVRRIYGDMARLYDAWGKPDSAAYFRRLEQPLGYTKPWMRWR